MKRTAALIFVAIMVLGMVPGALAATRFPNLIVTLINQEPDPVSPGNAFDIRFRVENSEASPANNVQVKLVFAYPFSVYGEESNERNIGSVTSSQADDFGVVEKWKLYVDPNAATGEQKIEFWYKIDQGAWTRAGEFDVTVRSTNPFLSIKEIKTDPEQIVPGTSTKVSFVLDNHADNDLRDITLNLQVYTSTVTASGIVVNELPFSPLGSGNEKTVSRIPRGQTDEITFELFTDADAQSKVYKVPFTLTYADSSGANFTRTGVLGLLVDSNSELSIFIDESQVQSAGATGKVTVKLVNKGFSDIKFLDVRLKEAEGFELLSTPEVYIGKLDSDDYETAEYTIHVSADAKDQVVLPLAIDFRDANGDLSQVEASLNLKLYSAQELKAKNGGSGGSFWFFAIVIVLAIAAIYVYRRVKHGSRKRS